MKNEISRRPTRLLLATLAVAAAAAVLPAADAAPRGGPDGMGPPPMMMLPLGGPRLDSQLDAAGATADQRTQIRTILDSARSDLRSIHESGRALQDQLATAFTQPTVDTRTVEALRQQMVAQHDKASQRSMQAMIDVSRVLSAEQRQALAGSMAEQRAAMARHHVDRAPADK